MFLAIGTKGRRVKSVDRRVKERMGVPDRMRSRYDSSSTVLFQLLVSNVDYSNHKVDARILKCRCNNEFI